MRIVAQCRDRLIFTPGLSLYLLFYRCHLAEHLFRPLPTGQNSLFTAQDTSPPQHPFMEGHKCDREAEPTDQH